MLLPTLIEELSSLIVGNELTDEGRMLDLVVKLTAQMKSDCHRSQILNFSGNIYKTTETILKVSTKDDLLLECFRFLRNSVAFSSTNQDHVRNTSEIIQITNKLLSNYSRGIENHQGKSQCQSGNDIERNSEGMKLNHETARIALQFLTNAVIGNEMNALVVANDATNYIFTLLRRDVNEAGFLTNTLFNIIPAFAQNFVDMEKFRIFLDNLESETNLLCLETLASNTDFLEAAYQNLQQEHRSQFLDILNSSPCKKSLVFFTKEFQSKADLLLKSDLARIETEFREILQLTCLISNFNEMEEIKLLQTDGALVTTITHLFVMTNSHKMFEPIEKLTTFSKEEQDHPTFMFKAHLVRLLGNLAYHHPENQNQIGINCLTQILNTTKIDTLNPFITQWSILAIRNLLENSPCNQDIVRGLQLSGSAYSTVLQEFGIQVNVSENGPNANVKVVPTPP